MNPFWYILVIGMWFFTVTVSFWAHRKQEVEYTLIAAILFCFTIFATIGAAAKYDALRHF